jgi:hypothetical protein
VPLGAGHFLTRDRRFSLAEGRSLSRTDDKQMARRTTAWSTAVWQDAAALAISVRAGTKMINDTAALARTDSARRLILFGVFALSALQYLYADTLLTITTLPSVIVFASASMR